ncbi:MAG: glycosyltransferase family 4 protein [Albidovulum sp.]
MKIAFYAPMKSPNHPVPSGDRLMAQSLVAALTLDGHEVELISELRSFNAAPDEAPYTAIEATAQTEVDRISRLWDSGLLPDLWFSYHPYYKAPDFLGPVLASKYNIPYITAETSYSQRRNVGEWARMQAKVLEGINLASTNICLTSRDRDGIELAAPGAAVSMLHPFIDATPFLQHSAALSVYPCRIITVAMMRPGDKMQSYQMLAEALARLPSDLPWSLSVVGDGEMRGDVAALFERFEHGRVHWYGQSTTHEIASLLSQSSVYVWPGYGEAYGLAYLEAQAAGLPVVAMRVAGVPEAVDDGVTGILTQPDDVSALALGIERLLTNETDRIKMGAAARSFVMRERTLDRAATRVGTILAECVGHKT